MAQSGSAATAGAAVVAAATWKLDAAALPQLDIATRDAYSDLDHEVLQSLLPTLASRRQNEPREKSDF